MADEKNYGLKIAELIEQAGEIGDQEFRMQIEALVEEAVEEVTPLLVPYLTNQSLDVKVRINIIRVVGYLQDSAFLIPLKKLIDKDANIRIKQQAIISVAKFNDRRALNILNTALKNLNNPMLASTINTELSRIKKNNPILGLMPRFTEGSKNPKTFKITLDILKRILTPTDATIFTKHLENPDLLVQNGSFEILCYTGDIFHDSAIFEFFEKRFNTIKCLAEPECDILYWLIMQYKQYLARYQFMIEEQIPNIIKKFRQIKDIRVQGLFIELICHGKKTNAVSFMDEIYPTEPKLQKEIIQAFSGNEIAVDFLFDKYEKDENLRDVAIESLLNIPKGLSYFTENFFGLEFETQEIVAMKLPYSRGHDLVDFIKQVFQGDIYRLKEILMVKVKETYEFSVKEILFDPEHEREFMFMGTHYMDTITNLFPVTATRFLLKKIAFGSPSVSKIKKYLTIIDKILTNELVFTIRDKDFITKLFNRIILSNNTELNIMFFSILKQIRTLDIETYKVLNDCLSIFITKREKNITPKEKGELRRVKQNLREVFYDFKKNDDAMQRVKLIFTKEIVAPTEKQPVTNRGYTPPPTPAAAANTMETTNFELMEKIITQNHLAVVLNIDSFIETLSINLQKAGSETIGDWTKFLTKFPRIAQLLMDTIEKKSVTNESFQFKDLRNIMESLNDEPLRIVLNFTNRQLTAILREQLQETVPNITLVLDEENLEEDDLLLTDAESLSDLILQSKTIPKKIYMFLEKAGNFASFRSYNPKTFVEPYTYYRVTKEILKGLYL